MFKLIATSFDLKDLRLGIAQMRIIPMRPKENLKNFLDNFLPRAIDAGANYLCAPELMFSGYLVGDYFHNPADMDYLMSFNEHMLRASEKIPIQYGHLFYDKNINKRLGIDGIRFCNQDGRPRAYNGVYVVDHGRYAEKVNDTGLLPPGFFIKMHLPNYRSMDEQRFWLSGVKLAGAHGVSVRDVISVARVYPDGRRALIVGPKTCEDDWHYEYMDNLEPIDVTQIQTDQGAQIHINSSASLFTEKKDGAVDRLLSGKMTKLIVPAGKPKPPIVYNNKVGTEDNEHHIAIYYGGSKIALPDSQVVSLSQDFFKQEMFFVNGSIFETTPRLIKHKRKHDIQIKEEATIEGLRHLNAPLMLGLSGGKDSAYALDLCCKAVGRDKVSVYNLPYSGMNKSATINNFRHLVDQYGVKDHSIAIKEMSDILTREVDGVSTELPMDKKAHDTWVGNNMARIRGTILSSISARQGSRLLMCGNKIEAILGYCTMHGDMNGAIAPLAEWYPDEIFEAMRMINKNSGKEMMPRNLIPDRLGRFGKDQTKPSAELETDQVDPILFYFDDAVLRAIWDYMIKPAEHIMKWYQEGTFVQNLAPFGMTHPLMQRYGMYNPEKFASHINWLIRTSNGNRFKYKYYPTSPILTKAAIGEDRRYSMKVPETTDEYTARLEAIKQMRRYEPQEKIIKTSQRYSDSYIYTLE